MKELKAVVQQIYPLKSADFEAFAAIFQPFEAKRKVYILRFWFELSNHF